MSARLPIVTKRKLRNARRRDEVYVRALRNVRRWRENAEARAEASRRIGVNVTGAVVTFSSAEVQAIAQEAP